MQSPHSPLFSLDLNSGGTLRRPLQCLDVCFLFGHADYVAVATNGGTIHVIQRRTKQCVRVLRASAQEGCKVHRVYANGNRLYAPLSDKSVRIIFLKSLFNLRD